MLDWFTQSGISVFFSIKLPTFLPAVENIPPTKNGKVKWILPVIILVGSLYAFYKIRNWMEQENEKSKNNKN